LFITRPHCSHYQHGSETRMCVLYTIGTQLPCRLHTPKVQGLDKQASPRHQERSFRATKQIGDTLTTSAAPIARPTCWTALLRELSNGIRVGGTAGMGLARVMLSGVNAARKPNRKVMCLR
jgi:hypothetical protein